MTLPVTDLFSGTLNFIWKRCLSTTFLKSSSGFNSNNLLQDSDSGSHNYFILLNFVAHAVAKLTSVYVLGKLFTAGTAQCS
jgi:hypothetical protein